MQKDSSGMGIKVLLGAVAVIGVILYWYYALYLVSVSMGKLIMSTLMLLLVVVAVVVLYMAIVYARAD